MKALFWNSEESRLRSFWRILLQTLILVVLLLLSSLVVGIAIAGLVMAEGESLPSQHDALMNHLLGRPGLRMLVFGAQFAAVAAAVCIAGRFLDRRRFRDFGFHIDRPWWRDFAFGLGLGTALVTLVFLALRMAGWLEVTGTFTTAGTGRNFIATILAALLSFVMVGFYEELYARGYLLTNVAEGLRGPLGTVGALLVATLLSSLVFGVAHLANPNAASVPLGRVGLNLVFSGVWLAAGYVLTGELAIPIGMHIAWNFALGHLFGLPVSGVSSTGGTIIASRVSGPTLWTGGAFGPEAGLFGLGAMGLGVVLIALWVRRQHGELRLRAAITEPPKRPAPVEP